MPSIDGDTAPQDAADTLPLGTYVVSKQLESTFSAPSPLGSCSLIPHGITDISKSWVLTSRMLQHTQLFVLGGFVELLWRTGCPQSKFLRQVSLPFRADLICRAFSHLGHMSQRFNRTVYVHRVDCPHSFAKGGGLLPHPSQTFSKQIDFDLRSFSATCGRCFRNGTAQPAEESEEASPSGESDGVG